MRLLRRFLSRLNLLFALGEQPLSSPEARARQANYRWRQRQKARLT
jgi:hypothetical protein